MRPGLLILAALVLVAAWLSPGRPAGAQVSIPSVSIAAAEAAEGQPLGFTVSLSAPSNTDIVVRWRTEDDPTSGASQAEADGDYAAFTEEQRLTLYAGWTTATILIPTVADALYEGDETFRVRLTGTEGVVILAADRALGTITEDDPAPTATLRQAIHAQDQNDAQVTLEGGSADEPAEMRFRVNLSAPSARAVTVPYTLGGTATENVDYTAPNPKELVIPAGALSGEIVLTTLSDSVEEDHETIVVTLGTPVGAVLHGAADFSNASGWIFDDDREQHIVLTVSPPSVPESLTTEMTYTVTASLGGGATAASALTVPVSVGGFSLAGGHTASHETDITMRNAVAGKVNFSITIAAGQNSGSNVFKAEVIADEQDEFDEAVTMSHNINRVASTGEYHRAHGGYSFFYPRLLITDDGDAANRPSVSVADAQAVAEGDDPSATTEMRFTVNLSQASGKDVLVTYALAGSATAGSDYELPATPTNQVTQQLKQPPLSVQIAAGRTSGTIVVRVQGDALDEGAGETIQVRLLSALQADLSTVDGETEAEGVITDDDATPSLAVADAAAVAEGGTAVFTVTLTGSTQQDVTFEWRTAADETSGAHAATAGEDYTAQPLRRVRIPAGTSSIQLEVATLEDETDEYAETFTVEISSAVGATITDADALGAISVDSNDPRPSVTIADAADVNEGDDPAATTDMIFTVSLSAASGKEVAVDYAVTSADATAGTDYIAPTSTTLTIPAGSASGSILVAIKGDLDEEYNEFITATISNPTNAALGDPSTARGRIADDDVARGKPWVYLSITEDSITEGSAATVVATAYWLPERHLGHDVSTWTVREDIVINYYASTHVDPATAHRWEHPSMPEQDAWYKDDRGAGLQEILIPAGQQSGSHRFETKADFSNVTGRIRVSMLTPGLFKSGGWKNIGNENGTVEPFYTTPEAMPYKTPGEQYDHDYVAVNDGPDEVEGKFYLDHSRYSERFSSGSTVKFLIRATAEVKTDKQINLLIEGPNSILDAADTGLRVFDWPVGTSTKTISIPTKANSAPDAETVAVSLKRGGYNRATTKATSQRLYVKDRWRSLVEITSPQDSIMEGETATLTVTFSPPLTNSAQQAYARVTTSGDFGTVVTQRGSPFVDIRLHPRGRDSLTFELSTDDDQVAEADGSLTVAIAPSGSFDIGPNGSVTITLRDNDRAGVLPHITVSSGGDIDEGADASFTVNAYPLPTSDLSVDLTVVDSGDFASSGQTGARQVTIPQGTGSASFTVGTTDDSTAEANGKITATADAGANYTVSQSIGSALVRVSDNDTLPLLSINAGNDITEGGTATFTITASPPPVSPLTVNLGVTESGSLGASGAATVTVSGAKTTYNVTTADDSVEEPDGSVTATLQGGSGYRLSPSKSAATVAVADNDAPPKPTVTLTGGPAVMLGGTATFTITADPAPAADNVLRVTVRLGQHYRQGAPFIQSGTHKVWIPTSGRAILTVPIYDRSKYSSNFVILGGRIRAELFHGDQSYRRGNVIAHVALSEKHQAELSIAAGSDITEGGTASFTITADPVPNDAITVNVGVSESGSFGASGSATVEVSGHKTTYTVTTINDQTDESDGSITATLQDGSDYTLLSGAESASANVSDDDDPAAVTPVLSITGGAAITEGGAATFAITASPAPRSPITVNVGVTESGDFGASGAATVEVSGASTTYSVTTRNDSADEPDGSVTATLQSGTDYTVSATAGSATVAVSDDDDAPKIPIVTTYTVSASVIADVKALAAQAQHGYNHVNRWNRVLVAFGEHDGTGVTGGAMTAEQAQQMADRHSSPVWNDVLAELTALEASQADEKDVVTATTELSITGGSAVTEGGAATFTITANPAPTSAITVKVGVSQSGAFGASGAATVQVSSASTTYTITTSDDSTDEPHGSVTATLKNGSGYTVSASNGAATVVVKDNDDPTVIVPELSIAGGNAITEGGAATFTITANPAPTSAITVKVGVSQSGAFGASGAATVTVSGASTTYTVTTTDDSTDEPNGSVMATLKNGSGYTVSPSSGAATVVVADNDAAPVVVVTPELSITAGSAVTEGGTASFTITATPAPTSPITVKVGVSQSGSFGASGAETVTVSSASTNYTITTSDDSTDEPNGSVTATLKPGNGYTVSSSNGAATVSIADNDVTRGRITISSQDSVIEGQTIVFTISLNPRPTQTFIPNIDLKPDGDFHFRASVSNPRITATRDGMVRVQTYDDNEIEPDGSYTVSVMGTSQYLGATKKVYVYDNDKPQKEITPEDACPGLPTVSINNPEAKRSDATVTFEISIDCKPSSPVTAYVAEGLDGLMVTAATTIVLSKDKQTATHTINVRPTGEQTLILAYATGAANRWAEGKVIFE